MYKMFQLAVIYSSGIFHFCKAKCLYQNVEKLTTITFSCFQQSPVAYYPIIINCCTCYKKKKKKSSHGCFNQDSIFLCAHANCYAVTDLHLKDQLKLVLKQKKKWKNYTENKGKKQCNVLPCSKSLYENKQKKLLFHKFYTFHKMKQVLQNFIYNI